MSHEPLIKPPLIEWMEIVNSIVFVLRGREQNPDLANRMDYLTRQVQMNMDKHPSLLEVEK